MMNLRNQYRGMLLPVVILFTGLGLARQFGLIAPGRFAIHFPSRKRIEFDQKIFRVIQ